MTPWLVSYLKHVANECRSKGLSIKGIKLEGMENGCKDPFVTTMGKLFR